MTCPTCDGRGRVNSCDSEEDLSHHYSPGGRYYHHYWKDCPQCFGSGEIPDPVESEVADESER